MCQYSALRCVWQWRRCFSLAAAAAHDHASALDAGVMAVTWALSSVRVLWGQPLDAPAPDWLECGRKAGWWSAVDCTVQAEEGGAWTSHHATSGIPPRTTPASALPFSPTTTSATTRSVDCAAIVTVQDARCCKRRRRSARRG